MIGIYRTTMGIYIYIWNIRSAYWIYRNINYIGIPFLVITTPVHHHHPHSRHQHLITAIILSITSLDASSFFHPLNRAFLRLVSACRLYLCRCGQASANQISSTYCLRFDAILPFPSKSFESLKARIGQQSNCCSLLINGLV